MHWHHACVGGYLLLLMALGTIAQNPVQEAWAHVYNPSRLQIHQVNVTVTGVIIDATAGKRKDGVRREADGDTHGWLALDPGQDKFLNSGNLANEGGNLVFEVVCYFPVTQKDAIAACRHYKSPITLPPVGSHVEVTGSWVMDDNHQHWNEIHPVFSMRVLPAELPEARWIDEDDGIPGHFSCPKGYRVPDVLFVGWHCIPETESH